MSLCECECGRVVPEGKNWNGLSRRFFSRRCKERAYIRWRRAHPNTKRPAPQREVTPKVLDRLTRGPTRDTRVVCPTCAVEKEMFMRWDNARGCQVVWESCRCGTSPQRPDAAGPRVRHYDQGAARLARLAKEVATASRRSQGKYAHRMGRMRQDLGREDAA